ncbi:HYR domain-containing protein [Bernardetia sp. OM2101]|uniref:HYR domain-containing protein n=1 Tax=Bernardetia sp. OM2101 TaxID=3344876 RepID=UPI0035CFC192
MKKLLLFLKNSILLFILLAISYQVKAQDTTPPVFAMPENASFDCVLNGQTRVLNYNIGAGDEFDDTILQATTTGGLLGGAFAQGGGITFDITPTNSIVITSFDLYLYTNGVATSFNVDVFYKRGSRVGFENNASAWTLAGTATIPFNGSTSLKNVDFGALGLLEGETYAIWIRGYAGVSAMVPVTNNAVNIGDANFTTANHHAVTGAFQGANIGGGPYYFRGNINYVLAPFSNVTQIAGLPSGSAFPIGVTTNTFTATDVAGNVATKSFTVTVNEDTQKPTLTAKTDYTRNTDTGNCTFTNTDIPNGIAADNCSVASYSYVLTGATTGTVTTLVNQAFNVGITTVTWTATDTNGNISNSDDFTVTVSDTQLPTLTAKTDYTRNADTGNCNFTNTDIPNGVATDNCSVASYSYVLTGATTGTVTTLVNQVFNLGVTTVTWTATDTNGNVSLSDDFTVTVSDNQLPTLTAKPNYTRNADTGNCSFINTDIPNGVATDNCSVASYSYVLTGATTGTVTTLTNQVFNLGVTTVTWTATDGSGNISLSDDFTVTVSDNQLPTLTAQADFTRNADTGNCSFINTDIPNGTATDNCSVASYLYVLTGATTGTITTLANQVFNVGTTTVTWTATDTNGNISNSDDFTVTVSDTQLPTLTAKTDYTRNADTGNCNFTNTDIPNGTATDNCTVASYSYVLTGATTGTVTTLANQVFNVGITTVTWTATDVNGNISNSDDFTVTVSDNQLPLLTAQADFTRNADTGNCSFINTDIPNGTATDNCTVASYSYVLTGATTGTVTTLANQVFNVGTTTVTWTATDANGNISNSDDFTVTVSDNQLPLLTAQTDFTRNADTGNCSFINTDIPNGTATDNCSVASYSYVLTGATTGTITTLANQVFNVGTTTVTWTATDAAGNTSASDDFTITVNDTQLPILTAKPNYTRNADNGVCSFTNTDIPNGVAADNCSVASYSYVLTGATTGTVTTLANQVFNLGTTTVTWTAIDVNGNTSASDEFTVTVNDTQLPTLTAQTDFTRNADTGNCNFINLIGATNIPNGIATDNCSVASYSYILTGATTGTVTTLANQVFNVGITIITWTATDVNGNISLSDDFTVTVSDTQNPTITCPTNIIVNNDPNICGAIVTFALPTVSDNCTIASLNQTAGIASGDLYPVGTTTNTFLVTDNNGNTATCSFDVTVNQRYELLYSTAGFSEIYPTTSGVLGNTISIKSYACDIFTGTNGENFIATGKVTVSNIPAGLTASIIKISDTELAFRLEGSAINNAVVDEIENLTVIFNDAAFVGVTAANVITSIKTDLVIRFLDFIPLNLRATAISTSQINLTWERNSQVHRAYRLYRNNRFVREFPTTITSYSDENLNPDTRYSYKLVGVVNQNIESDASRANEWTFPEKPILLSISTICGEGKANLKIEGSGTIFRVYAQETNGNLLLESSNGSFELPSISETTTFYASVIGRGGTESERIPILVNVQPTFEAKIVGENNRESCENSIELTAQEVENATYTWFLNGTNLGTNGQTITANYSGNYQVFVQKGVCSFMSEKVKVKLNQNPVAKIQQSNSTKFCQNGTINAVSTGENINYEWILNNVIVGNNQSLNVTQSGIYTLQITNATGCQASSEIEIIVTDIPQTPILEASESIICPNTETTISIQNPQNDVIYQWFRNGGNLRKNGNSISTSIKGSYEVRAISNQNNACNSLSNELEINHFEVLPIYLRISEDKTSLFVEDVNLSQSEIANIEWYFEGELETDLGSTFEISPTVNGNYSAKITNQNGCLIQTRTVYFSVPKTPVITGKEDLKNDLFKIYPNPSSGLFNIHFGNSLTEDIQITVFDGIGRKIYTKTLEKGSQDFKISLQNKPSGMYMIRFNQTNSVYSKQIIIE